MLISFLVSSTMLSDLDELPTIKLGDFTLEIEMNDLSPEMQEVARKELRETPDVKRDAIVALRDLLKGQYRISIIVLLASLWSLNCCYSTNQFILQRRRNSKCHWIKKVGWLDSYDLVNFTPKVRLNWLVNVCVCCFFATVGVSMRFVLD